MRYRSKIGILWIIVIAMIGYGHYLLIRPLVDNFSWLGFWMNIIILGIVDFLYIACTIGTYYQFHDDVLEVRCGYFFHEDIPYYEIRSFKETHNPLSSCGLSLDRLDIIYKAQKGRNGNSEVYISPVRKQEFIDELEKRTRITITK